jgi:SAM-dependent methyltransferase
MFTKSAAYYDLVYGFKDQAAEAERVRLYIREAKQSRGPLLLDVACGTGQPLQYFAQHFDAEGLDLDPELLAIAQQRLPTLRFTAADMVDFDLGRRLDAIVCLFSSIGYVGTLDRLRQTARALARHVPLPGWLAGGCRTLHRTA